jgi:hypothetical protein
MTKILRASTLIRRTPHPETQAFTKGGKTPLDVCDYIA